jgi:hypothetical protein
VDLHTKEKLLNMIQDLDPVQLQKLINFTDDLKKQTRKSSPEKALIDSIHGKYKAHLSSSDEFARKKETEIQLEEEKWSQN